MEVVAGAASVAGVVGILGLVGQAVHGVLKLKEFAHGVSNASKTVKSFLEAIDSLESALIAVSDLLKRAPEEWLTGAEAQNTSTLTSQVEKCRADIGEWVKDVPVHHANSSKATKSFFRKLRVASDGSAYSQFHEKVARHLQGMQMSLDILQCRYSTHIFKQGGLIAEEVRSFADSQSSFNGESTKRFLELDKSFAARMDPVSGQLDRLESSSRMSSASMSSLASNVSRILELVSSNPALAVSEASHDEDEKSKPDVAHASLGRNTFEKPKTDPRTLQRPSLLEWSCDFLPGIEAAFSASGFSCLYCADEFDQDSAEWSLRARHLVDEHRYGECNLLLAYDSEEKFAKHIQEFHQCSLGHVYHLYNELLDKHCRFGRQKGFHRGQESNDQNLTDDFHSIRSRRWEALFDNHRGLKAVSDHSRGAKFVLAPEIAQETQPVQQPWVMGFYNAISEEGCIVDGLMVASIFRPRSIFNPYGDNMKKPCYSLGDGIKVSRYEFDDRCVSFFAATRLLHTHDTNEKRGLGDGESLGKPSASSIVPEGCLDTAEITNQRNQINSWLLKILTVSTTTRIIVFHTMTHGVNCLDMDTWLEKVLEFWETDEAATKVDEPDNSSDGAVDSRGSPEVRSVTNYEHTEPLDISEGWRPYHASSAP